MEQFEAFLSSHLPTVESFHPHYESSLHQMLIGGGKRFRPALLLGVVGAYNPLLIQSAYSVALAIELLHTYSLIHDDLPAMDNADLRRGLPTLHKTYDEVSAILAGDALNTYAFEVLSNAPLSDRVIVKLVRSLAYNGGVHGMVLGQAIDCHFENQRLELDQVKMLHIHKTGKLIAASLQMGAFIVGRDDLAHSLYDFGIDLGLLFQIQDDILDVTQNDEQAGKTTNNDQAKNSFVTLLGFEKAMEEADVLAEKITQQMMSFDENLQRELSPTLNHYINRHKD
ncbi:MULTISPECIES: polyprenyl synthetase family protein [unclassified Sulfuricurvum]|uniref:polyprenyl synthetase family protein n=1 Tax=unclassified Sulfuricurvum TaxID=2632390 RepID=UPI0002999BD4|nr:MULTISPECIES: polyprenyl synthetase family protein [unclassified Sulfuricurvum]OHD80813.1 MAG: geranyl transferase [Sulfuricurvum sp. RIFCSPHIGHO2_02_FULL_43_9]OHD84755.1 MAG: geranyl transferase [Sulfuricurvum sp. RIFCSPHIGHO2_12_FULL_44_8]OHD85386.1 MAG: geranyl transferase [Sulfuricurvum sp. RIFCSPLOWO2_02_FULL_43_45]OHD88114.1 MAG: geranyl transferase [Sulfuricurvum sp. RIFCSPLOWO2_02_43_6]OHD92128.1 MAG: geranyl transferase [Sulfuricurvum sp. RIFCSPLOWO2_12_43_5]